MSAVFTLEQAAQLITSYNVKVGAIDTKATNAAAAAAAADTKAVNAAQAAATADTKAVNAATAAATADTKAVNAATAAAAADTKATNAATAAATANSKAEEALGLISDLESEKQEKILKHVINIPNVDYGNFKIIVLNHSITNLTIDAIIAELNTRESLISISPADDGTIILNYANNWHKQTVGGNETIQTTCTVMYNDGSVSADETLSILTSDITQTKTDF